MTLQVTDLSGHGLDDMFDIPKPKPIVVCLKCSDTFLKEKQYKSCPACGCAYLISNKRLESDDPYTEKEKQFIIEQDKIDRATTRQEKQRQKNLKHPRLASGELDMSSSLNNELIPSDEQEPFNPDADTGFGNPLVPYDGTDPVILAARARNELNANKPEPEEEAVDFTDPKNNPLIPT